MIKSLLTLLLLTPIQPSFYVNGDLPLPAQAKECLKRVEVKGSLEIRVTKKPYLLKGDFDGDSKSDYAIALGGPKTRRNGVLVCTAKKEAIILGADMPKDPPFSDMPDDNFVAPRWKVAAKREADKLYNYDGDKPVKVASPKGDSIAMLWEDGTCLIYWDGSRYRWGCGQ
jgi:hypothetical protein